MSPTQWLRATVLARNELTLSDSRPLYAYRCSNQLFERMGESLKPAFYSHGGRFLIADEWAAMYCLYAAEWWRRNHEGGTWSWNGIDKSLEWKNFPYAERHNLIRLGLKWWKRPLLQRENGDTLFLVTIACEGGLPLNLLNRTDTGLGRYFKAMLIERQLLRSGDADTRLLAERMNNYLPKSLHNDVVYELSARLIDAVATCRQQLGQISQHPLEQLDDINPSWRENFPLLLDDGVAQQLIADLLAEKSTPNRVASRDFCTITRSLVRSGAGLWELKLQINLPPRIAEDALKQRLPAEASPPANLELRAQIGDNEHSIALLSRLATGKTEWQVNMTGQVPVFSILGDQAADEVGFRLVCGATEYATWTSNQCTAPAPDLPWLFASPSGASGADVRELDFIGCGTITTRETCIFAALPDFWQIALVAKDPSGYLGDNKTHDRKIYQIIESIQLRTADGETCSLELGASTDDLPAYQVHGDRVYWNYHKHPVYAGLPRITYSNDEEQTSVDYGELFWRSASLPNQQWKPVLRFAPFGDVRFRHITNKGVRFDFRAVVLPANAAIGIATRGANAGTITLAGFNAIDCAIDSSDASHIECNDGNYTVYFQDAAVPNHSTRIKMTWRDANATFSLPTPIESSAFILSNDEQIDFKSPLSIDEVMGVTARVISPNRDRFHMEVGLRDPAMSRTMSQTYNRRVDLEQRNGIHSLALGTMTQTLRRLLSLGSNSLDVAVRLTLSNNQHNRIRVQLFRTRLSVDRDSLVVKLGENAPLDHSNITIEAVSLWALGERVELPRDQSEAIWSATQLNPDHAPWIVAAWRQGALIGRPTWIPILANRPSAEDQHTPPDPMSAVIQEPDYQQRLLTIQDCVAAMAIDPSHPGWSYLKKSLTTLHDYPPTSFDFVVQLAENPCALATGLFAIRGDAANLYWQLAEQMGFDWHLLPLGSWINAATVHRDMLQAALPDDSQHLALEATRKIIRQITEHMPEFEMLMQILSERLDRNQPTPRQQGDFDAQCVRYLLTLRSRLLQEHALASKWPNELPQQEWLSTIGEVELPELQGMHHLEDLRDHRQAVVNAPVLAGLQLARDQYPCRNFLSYLIAFREFDREWFDSALGMVLSWGYLRRDWTANNG